MMRLWKSSYTRPAAALAAASAALSIATHTAIVTAWVLATLPAHNVVNEDISTRTYYIPPPDRVAGQQGTRETVHYVDLTREGPGAGDGPRVMGDAHPPLVAAEQTVGRTAPDSVTTPATPPVAGPVDSVFSVLDVDTAVVRSASSAAPAYPLSLLEKHIMGAVAAQYIVDTTGFADTASFVVMKATHPEFVTAVREALPYMRFKPAKIGPMKVRQLVEQQFTFRISDTAKASPRPKKP